MKKDRLRSDKEEIHNLDQLIEARDPGTSHLARDTDAFDCDIEIDEDVDVDEALTLPHTRRDPHREHEEIEHIELMDTPNELDMDEDWADQDILPTDYAQGYDEAITTDVRDDVDEIVEEEIHEIDHPSLDDIASEPSIDVMPDVFTPDEEDSAER